MRVALRMAQVGVEHVEALRRQLVLGLFRRLVKPRHRHVRVVGQIALPQAVSAHHVQRPTLTLRRQAQPLGPARQQTARLHLSDEVQHPAL